MASIPLDKPSLLARWCVEIIKAYERDNESQKQTEKQDDHGPYDQHVEWLINFCRDVVRPYEVDDRYVIKDDDDIDDWVMIDNHAGSHHIGDID